MTTRCGFVLVEDVAAVAGIASLVGIKIGIEQDAVTLQFGLQCDRASRTVSMTC